MSAYDEDLWSEQDGLTVTQSIELTPDTFRNFEDLFLIIRANRMM